MPLIPLRIQRKRTKGWKTPPNTVYVGRNGFFGNPYGNVKAYEMLLEYSPILKVKAIEKLKGKNLSCWCKLCEKHKDGKPLNEHCPDCAPCHVDVIGKFLYGEAGQ